ncbi:hypothetical protein F4553_007822 [Allocatelliglobosispora scoriae]|uniref:Uncharacterized protein n=1 Tax=Allocatelliglobosispora scoriae TaxID=643052 RepID=A0A841C3Q3_9ACTN|nr:hypothetical protein [Allocatelliglobosispora scoriae]MBB5874388.1 hypothetical protein [Allocatelliglobosispora scoriae]
MSDAVAGVWDLVLKTPIGSLSVVYTFTGGGDAVSGTAEGRGETVPLAEIACAETADGLRVTWRQSVTRPIRLHLDFDTVVRGDTMTGHSRAGKLPRSSVTGTRRGT